MRLWLFLSTLTSGLFLGVFMLFGLYLEHHQVQRQHQEIRRDAANLAEHVAASVTGHMVNGDVHRLELQLLRIAAIHPDLRALQVADGTGSIVASVRAAPDAPPRLASEDLDSPMTGLPGHAAAKLHWHQAPVLDGPEVGRVQVVTSLDAVIRARDEMRAQFLSAGLLAVLFISLLLTLFLRPVSRVLEEASRFAEGLLYRQGGRLESDCKLRELGQLNDALNRTAQTLQRQDLALSESESIKGAIMTAALDGVIALDDGRTVIEANPAAEQIFGHAPGSLIGRSLAELLATPAAPAETSPCLTSLLSGSDNGWEVPTPECADSGRRMEARGLRLDGRECTLEITRAGFEHAGRAYLLLSLRDVTQQRWMELEQRNITVILRNTINELAAQQFALDEHAIVSITDLDGNIVYANDKFVEISQYKLPELLGQNHRLLKSGLHPRAFYEEMWGTISSGRTWQGKIVNRRKDGELYWVDSTIVPVLGDDKLPLQYLSIRTDITELQRARMALDQARAQELVIGNQIQRTLLFGEVPRDLGPLSVCVHTEASQGIDGDFYEFFSYGEDRFDIAIGDVMGKGVSAALIGAAVKQQLNQLIAEQLARDAGHIPSPATLINALHAKVTRQLIELDSFITLNYLGFDLERGEIQFVGAGHPPAIVAGQDGVRQINGDNLPLGVLLNERYRQQVVAFPPGDLICLYSDGLTEAKNGDGEEFGHERLASLVHTLHAAKIPTPVLVEAIRANIRTFSSLSQPLDDRSIIVLRNRVESEPGCVHTNFDLPWKLDGLTPLQTDLRAFAQAAGLADAQVDGLVLASFEAASNILRHVKPELDDARIHCGLKSDPEGVRVRMEYLGQPFTPPDTTPDFSGASEGGFGLYIIRHSIDAVRHEQPAPGICRVELTQRRH